MEPISLTGVRVKEGKTRTVGTVGTHIIFFKLSKCFEHCNQLNVKYILSKLDSFCAQVRVKVHICLLHKILKIILL